MVAITVPMRLYAGYANVGLQVTTARWIQMLVECSTEQAYYPLTIPRTQTRCTMAEFRHREFRGQSDN